MTTTDRINKTSARGNHHGNQESVTTTGMAKLDKECHAARIA